MKGYDYGNLTAGLNSSDNCDMNHSDPAYMARESVQAEATNWSMYGSLLGFLPSIISPIILGSLADKYGRRFLFILPNIGSILAVAVYMVTIHFKLPIWVLLFAQIESCFGGMGVLITGSFAYIADTVPPKKRALRMTVIDSVSLANGAVGSLFVGYWIKAQGFFNPLIFVICGKFLALIYAIFIIPETLKQDDTNEPRCRKLAFKDTISAINLCLYDNGTRRRWKLNVLLGAVCVGELVTIYSVMLLYQMNAPLCWGSVQIGYFSFATIMLQCVTMLIMSGIPHRWIAADWKVVLSRFSTFAGSLYMVFVVKTFMMYLGEVIHNSLFPGI